jgi:endogenous inhibitor of DNA gyrase (YacG/DUF329 family)
MDIKDKALLMLKDFAEHGPYWFHSDRDWGDDIECAMCGKIFESEEEADKESEHYPYCRWRKAKEFTLALYYNEYQFPVEEKSGEKEGESE